MSDRPQAVLYVDDDVLSREVFELWMVDLPNISQVITISDNTDFMQKVRDLPTIPDVVFLDIQMHPHNGYEMLNMLRSDATFQDTTIIALTANVMATDIKKLKAAGFSGLIGKPIMPEIFTELVQKIIAGEPVWFVY